MKKILKIVITGGPCAGKTSALRRIKERYSKMGFEVIHIPETATELISGGISPMSVGSWAFQNHLLRLQLYKEEMFESGAKCLKNDKIIMIFDRAVIDNKGYMSHSDFYKMIGEAGLNEKDLLARYDGVLHLETVAKTSPALYQTRNNEARFETVDGAVKTDHDLHIAWKQHPNFFYIRSDISFENKANAIFKAIDKIIENKKDV